MDSLFGGGKYYDIIIFIIYFLGLCFYIFVFPLAIKTNRYINYINTLNNYNCNYNNIDDDNYNNIEDDYYNNNIDGEYKVNKNNSKN